MVTVKGKRQVELTNLEFQHLVDLATSGLDASVVLMRQVGTLNEAKAQKLRELLARFESAN